MYKFYVIAFLLLFVSNSGLSQKNINFEYEMSECETENGFEIVNELISINHHNDSTEIIIKGIANCEGIHHVSVIECNDTLRIDFKQGTLIEGGVPIILSENSVESENVETDSTTENYIIYSEEEVIMAACNCCYTFRFLLSSLEPEKSYEVFFSGESLKPKN